jgi:type II secretory pathway component HofQ
MAVDARTNRLIIRGAADRVAEIVDLIEQLDVPASESQTTEDRAGYGSSGSPRGNYGGTR